MNAPRSSLIWLWLSALAIVLDQLSKWAVVSRLAAYIDTMPLTSFLNLVHVHNTGAAFSLFANQSGWQRFFFLGVGILAAAVIFYLLKKSTGRPLFAAALALILGGALGNVIDRVRYGYVIDFLDFYLNTWHFPAFNVADSAITLGAGLLIWDSLKRDGRA
jgi:signal peptidase II